MWFTLVILILIACCMSIYKGQAAVLLVTYDSPEGLNGEHILLTKRAEHLSSHSGEVAFPGGMWEEDDDGLEATALRESQEEVGLCPKKVKIQGQLPVSHTRQGTRVTPYFGQITSKPELQANPEELDALFWVPLELFLKDERSKTNVFHLHGKEYWAPVYEFQGYIIWGFTSRVIVEYLNSHLDQRLSRSHSAPEVFFSGS